MAVQYKRTYKWDLHFVHIRVYSMYVDACVRIGI
jgi:hypothetical protein